MNVIEETAEALAPSLAKELLQLPRYPDAAFAFVFGRFIVSPSELRDRFFRAKADDEILKRRML